MLEWCFLIFRNFLLFFLEFSCPGRVGTEFDTKICFFSFSAYLILVWIEITLEWCFLIFKFFCYFFWNFLAWVGLERKLGLNFFFSLSRFISSWFQLKYCWNDVFILFYWVLCFFFWNFLAWVGLERNSGLKYFLSFSVYLILVWNEIMLEWCFLIFWIFFSIFFGIFLPRLGRNGIWD